MGGVNSFSGGYRSVPHIFGKLCSWSGNISLIDYVPLS